MASDLTQDRVRNSGCSDQKVLLQDAACFGRRCVQIKSAPWIVRLILQTKIRPSLCFPTLFPVLAWSADRAALDLSWWLCIYT